MKPSAQLEAGRKFKFLTVVSYSHKSALGQHHWLCRCDCGKTKAVQKSNLSSGRVGSCGCMRSKWISAKISTHKRSHSKIYIIWQSMMRRCYDPRVKNYHRYGGRGIKVCDKWHKFENFFADMGLRPSNRSLERKNNNGNYELNNCEWATNDVQANNRSTSRYLIANGEKRSVSQWARLIGVPPQTITFRIQHGWSDVDAATKPPRKRIWKSKEKTGKPLIITFRGESLPLKIWSERTGICYHTLRTRLGKGWSIEKSILTPLVPHGYTTLSEKGGKSLAEQSKFYGKTVKELLTGEDLVD